MSYPVTSGLDVDQVNLVVSIVRESEQCAECERDEDTYRHCRIELNAHDLGPVSRLKQVMQKPVVSAIYVYGNEIQVHR